MCFIIWITMIVLCKIDSYLMHCCSLLKLINQNLNLKFHQMNFWFEILDIHMNEKTITCHDCYGFKWQNINIYPILTIFSCGMTPILVHWIVATPKCVFHSYTYWFNYQPTILVLRGIVCFVLSQWDHILFFNFVRYTHRFICLRGKFMHCGNKYF